MNKRINKLLHRLSGFVFVSHSMLKRYRAAYDSNCHTILTLAKLLGGQDKSFALLGQSHSQYAQDLAVCFLLNFKEQGYFVEFGAANGKYLSNTYLLETQFKWHGILSEPAKQFHQELLANRHCHIDLRCVHSQSGESLLFKEVECGAYSTLAAYAGADKHKDLRKIGTEYLVETVTLQDLLQRYNAPEVIDYLSIDTEGSEYDILKAFDFTRYTFKIITVEHNFSSRRNHIKSLLEAQGYKRILTAFSKVDDWYINPDVMDCPHTLSALNRLSEGEDVHFK